MQHKKKTGNTHFHIHFIQSSSSSFLWLGYHKAASLPLPLLISRKSFGWLWVSHTKVVLGLLRHRKPRGDSCTRTHTSASQHLGQVPRIKTKQKLSKAQWSFKQILPPSPQEAKVGRIHYLLIYSKGLVRTKVGFHASKVTWHLIQDFFTQRDFPCTTVSGQSEPTGLCLCYTTASLCTRRGFSLQNTDTFISFWVGTLIPSHLTGSLSPSNHSQRVFSKVLLPSDTEGRTQDRLFTLCDLETFTARHAATSPSQDGTWDVKLLFP